MDATVFVISGVLSVLAALLVVTRRNPVYSAIYLVLFFVCVSLDFFILQAPFLAIVQVLVYGGAIMVLFLFVIMLLNLSPEELRETVPPSRRAAAAAVSLGLLFLLVTAIGKSPTVQQAGDLTASTPDGPAPAVVAAGQADAIGESLFTVHALEFEFASILILVAILGAIHLTRRDPRGAHPPAEIPVRAPPTTRATEPAEVHP